MEQTSATAFVVASKVSGPSARSMWTEDRKHRLVRMCYPTRESLGLYCARHHSFARLVASEELTGNKPQPTRDLWRETNLADIECSYCGTKDIHFRVNWVRRLRLPKIVHMLSAARRRTYLEGFNGECEYVSGEAPVTMSD